MQCIPSSSPDKYCGLELVSLSSYSALYKVLQIIIIQGYLIDYYIGRERFNDYSPLHKTNSANGRQYYPYNYSPYPLQQSHPHNSTHVTTYAQLNNSLINYTLGIHHHHTRPPSSSSTHHWLIGLMLSWASRLSFRPGTLLPLVLHNWLWVYSL